MAYYPRDIMCGTCGEALAVKRGPDKRPICEMCDQTKASEPMSEAVRAQEILHDKYQTAVNLDEAVEVLAEYEQ